MRRLLKKGWCLLERYLWGWETHERRVFMSNLGESWETNIEDP